METEFGFLAEMITHHREAMDTRMAVRMANRVVSGGLSDRPEVRALANDMIRTENEEIERMETWPAEWYGEKTDGHMQH